MQWVEDLEESRFVYDIYLEMMEALKDISDLEDLWFENGCFAGLGPLLAKEVMGERFKERIKVEDHRDARFLNDGEDCNEESEAASSDNECGQDEFQGEDLIMKGASWGNESKRYDEPNGGASSDNGGNVEDFDVGELAGELDHDGSDTPWSDADSNDQGMDEVPIWWYECST